MRLVNSCFASVADAVYTIRLQRNAEINAKGLGVFQIMLRIAIFAYIIIYVMIMQKGYCILVPTLGTVKLGVRAPAADVHRPNPNIDTDFVH